MWALSMYVVGNVSLCPMGSGVGASSEGYASDVVSARWKTVELGHIRFAVLPRGAMFMVFDVSAPPGGLVALSPGRGYRTHGVRLPGV